MALRSSRVLPGPAPSACAIALLAGTQSPSPMQAAFASCAASAFPVHSTDAGPRLTLVRTNAAAARKGVLNPCLQRMLSFFSPLSPRPPIPQDAGRRVSFYTFAHVLGLDLAFHLNRKTGWWAPGGRRQLPDGCTAGGCVESWLLPSLLFPCPPLPPLPPSPPTHVLPSSGASCMLPQAPCLACLSGVHAVCP